MRVNNHFLAGPLTPWSPLPVKPRAEGEAAPSAFDAVHTSSAELARWTALAAREEEVRPDRLAQVEERIGSGYYDRTECVEQIAAALLQAAD